MVYNKYWHKWWLRCRAGALFLGYKKRGQCDSDCPECENELETREHFLWECEREDVRSILHVIPKVLVWESEVILKWMLHEDRYVRQRNSISGYIVKRWKERERVMQERGQNALPRHENMSDVE